MQESFDESAKREKKEALSKIRTYKQPIHPDFAWWKEREKVGGYYSYLRSAGKAGEPTAPPEEILRTLDKFESLLAWFPTKPIGQEMTAYEKAQIVCKLLEATTARDLSFDVYLKGDPDYPVWTRVEGGGSGGEPLKIEKED